MRFFRAIQALIMSGGASAHRGSAANGVVGSVVAALLGVSLQAHGAASGETAVYQFFPPQTAKETKRLQVAVTWLSAHARAESRTLAPDEDLIRVLKERYGDAWPFMWPPVRKYLLDQVGLPRGRATVAPSRLVLDKAMQVLLPPGPRWKTGTAVFVTKGDSLSSLAKEYTGHAVLEMEEAIALENHLSTDTELQPGERLLVTKSEPVQLTGVNLLEAAEALRDVGVERDPGKAVVLPVAPQLATASQCKAAGSRPGYPVNWTAVREQLKINTQFLEKSGGSRAGAVTVAVIDSGVSMDEPQWQRMHFWSDNFRTGPNGVLWVGYDFTRYTDAYQFWPAVAAADEKIHNHGTHVGGIIDAAPSNDPEVESAVKQMIELFILKIVGGGSDQSTADVDGQALTDALSEVARRDRVKVINLSIESGHNEAVLAPMADALGKLFVVAAGNDASNVDRTAEVPAFYGSKDNVITVAAHGPDNALAEFSAFGPRSVDIAAPGVCIHSYAASGPTDFADYSGTSQAAPFVALTAGLLSAYQLSPAAIKHRIIASADYQPSYEDPSNPGGLRVLAGGQLNIVNALSLYDDILDEDKGLQTTYRRGVAKAQTDADPDSDVLRVGESVIALSCALSVQRISSDRSPLVRVWRVLGAGANEKLDHLDGVLKSVLRLQSGRGEKAIDFRQVKSLVLSQRLHHGEQRCTG